jgi:cytochrome c biogenesis protein CcmG/thiol:disulfide interchange protein DsbE
MLRVLGFVVSLALLLGLLGLLAYGLTSRPLVVGAAAEGRPANDFRLPSFDGQSIALSDSQGRVVVLNFWASWCAPCRVEAPVLEQAWRQYRDQGVVVLGINIWDKEPEARAFKREFGLTYPNVLDDGGRVAIEYGVAGIPETIVIGSDGRVAAKHTGPVTAERIAELVRSAGVATR